MKNSATRRRENPPRRHPTNILAAQEKSIQIESRKDEIQKARKHSLCLFRVFGFRAFVIRFGWILSRRAERRQLATYPPRAVRCFKVWDLGTGSQAHGKSFVVTAFMRSLVETLTTKDPMNRVTTNDEGIDAPFVVTAFMRSF